MDFKNLFDLQTVWTIIKNESFKYCSSLGNIDGRSSCINDSSSSGRKSLLRNFIMLMIRDFISLVADREHSFWCWNKRTSESNLPMIHYEIFEDLIMNTYLLVDLATSCYWSKARFFYLEIWSRPKVLSLCFGFKKRSRISSNWVKLDFLGGKLHVILTNKLSDVSILC